MRQKEVHKMNSFLSPLYGSYRNRKFTDIYGDVDTFIADYKGCGIPAKLKDDNIQTLYYLLYARYGNSTIASSDETQFTYKIFSIIFQYGPTWEKELEIQDKVRALTDDELEEGSTHIYNHSYNPSTEPSTDTLTELPTINEQNTTKMRRGKVEQYTIIMEMLKRDVTNYFIDRFKPLFLTIVNPEVPLYYVTEDDE